MIMPHWPIAGIDTGLGGWTLKLATRDLSVAAHAGQGIGICQVSEFGGLRRGSGL